MHEIGAQSLRQMFHQDPHPMGYVAVAGQYGVNAQRRRYKFVQDLDDLVAGLYALVATQILVRVLW